MASHPVLCTWLLPQFGFLLLFSQSSNANSLSGLNPFKLTPSTWETTSVFTIDTLYSQYDYQWVPLVLELIGPIDQFSLNVFSMANALTFDLFNLKPFAFGFWP